jgi:hypothetical protein
MSESSQRVAPLPRRTLRTIVRTDIRTEQLSKFGRVCLVLWPDEKADVVLSQKLGCSERAAQFWITGDRDPSLGAILLVINEIRGRRRA